MTKQKTVFVGLSGGVDSSVAALRLIKAGYNVVGVFIKVWQPDFLECNWEAERLDAMRVAAKLNIQFLTCDAAKDYERDVAQYFIRAYEAGRTPNPDVMCNKYVKFGSFLRFAQEQGADFIATGHYAQKKTNGNMYELHRGKDTNKDQSYFLWTLTQEQLQHTLLPVGDSTKSLIRHEAEAAGLVTADKKDSQGVCFLGHIDIPEFLSHFITLQPGSVLNVTGEIIGEHQGALVYTKGQRHGFAITKQTQNQTAHYVIDRDMSTNTITVGNTPPSLEKGSVITITDCNFITTKLSVGDQFEIQTRYRQRPTMITINAISSDSVTIENDAVADSISSGQSCVFYRGELCLGGGIIA